MSRPEPASCCCDAAGVRWPGVLRDVVVSGARARARLEPAVALRLCDGHFPGEPFLPGAYSLGLLAELATVLLEHHVGWPARIARVERATFRLTVDPRRQVVLEARRDDGSDHAMAGEVRVGGELAVSARLLCEEAP